MLGKKNSTREIYTQKISITLRIISKHENEKMHPRLFIYIYTVRYVIAKKKSGHLVQLLQIQ